MIKIQSVDNIHHLIKHDDDLEFRKIYEYFRIVNPALEWTPAVRSGVSDGKKAFIALNGLFFCGIKDKIIKFCKQEKIECVDETTNTKYNLLDSEWDEFMSLLSLPFTPYDYQVEGAKLAIREQRMVILSATGCLDGDSNLKVKLTKKIL